MSVPVRTLAVLPFKPLTASDRNESLELGMTETLIAGLNSGSLGDTPEFRSPLCRHGTGRSGGGAGARVQAVLEGHIQRAGAT